MKKIVFAIIFLIISSCALTQESKRKNKDIALKYAETITYKELNVLLTSFASDEFEGRKTGEDGQKKAANFLRDFYSKEGIKSPQENNNYFQIVPASFMNPLSRQGGLNDSENVVAFIKGSEKPDEIIVISAHLDHLGRAYTRAINYGADDNGSGTVAILEIAQAFKKAVEDGKGPKRSILFLHVTGEEQGLLGSKYYTENPIFPIKKTVANLNTDMIGRVDVKHQKNPNYIYLIGSDKLSTELHDISETVNKKYLNLSLDYSYNDDDDPNLYYYRSDHYNFAEFNVPVIFYFSGTHIDYHEPSDTSDKINYEQLENRARLIFYTAWEIANRKDRIVADKATKE